jgi:hypothetical protein
MAEISPLRRRVIEDMTVRNLSPTTQRFYLAAVSKLSRHFGRSELLHRSGELADLEALEQSWFEDDAQIAEIVAGRYGRGRAKLAAYLVQSVIARRRDKWAELFLRTVLWMREAPPEVDLCWRELNS